MNILSMLARLEDALGCTDLTKQMVLLPKLASTTARTTEDVNLVVGYNGSPRSQTALDLTLWIAHQTRLATRRCVTVQVVYVVNLTDECNQARLERSSFLAGSDRPTQAVPKRSLSGKSSASGRQARQRSNSAVAELPSVETVQSCQLNQFEHADRILWQARNLADEWRGSLKTHLRFGHVAEQLRQVVEAESAAVLLLGCSSTENSVVQQLGSAFPCPVLGIPPAL